MSRWLPFVGMTMLLAWMAPVWSGWRRLAFRDVGYFYTPMRDYVSRRCGESWSLPFSHALWNPLDLTGMPLAGETTTAVFDPLSRVIDLFGVSAATSLAIMVTAHLMLASWTSYDAARRQRLSPLAALIVSLVYPMSGGVMFLATNPPFLVGAAWMPLVLGRWFERPRDTTSPAPDTRHGILPGRVVIPAIGLAMMVLGGDPQMALCTVIMAAIVQLTLAVTKKQRGQVSFLLLGPLLAAGLCMPQLAASLDWARISDRVSDGGPAEAYAFSVSPWRWLEIVIPDAMGTPWPVNTRWDRLLMGDRAATVSDHVNPADALWTPTVYAGTLAWVGPCWAVVAMIRRRRRGRPMSTRQVIWSTVLLWSAAAAMGAYGPAYFVQILTPWGDRWSSAAGGPAWWLHEFFPGYASFRYPSKWLPLVSLTLAMAAGRAADQIRRHSRWRGISAMRFGDNPRLRNPDHGENRRRLRAGTMAVLALLLLLGMGVDASLRGLGFNDLFFPDPFWGPLDVAAAIRNWRWSIGAAMLGVVSLAIIAGRTRPSRTPWWLVGLVIAELFVAHHDLIPTIDHGAEQRWLAQTPRRNPPGDAQRWLRTKSDQRWPEIWKTTRDEDRLLHVEVAARAAGFGRWHLERDQAVFNGMTSIQPAAVTEFWRSTRRRISQLPADAQSESWDEVAQMLGKDLRTIEPADADAETDANVTWEVLPYPDPQRERWTIDAPEPIRCVRKFLQDGHWHADIRDLDRPGAPWRTVNVTAHQQLFQSIECPAGRWEIRWQYRPWWFLPSIVIGAVSWIGLAWGPVTRIVLFRSRTACRRRG